VRGWGGALTHGKPSFPQCSYAWHMHAPTIWAVLSPPSFPPSMAVTKGARVKGAQQKKRKAKKNKARQGAAEKKARDGQCPPEDLERITSMLEKFDAVKIVAFLAAAGPWGMFTSAAVAAGQEWIIRQRGVAQPAHLAQRGAAHNCAAANRFSRRERSRTHCAVRRRGVGAENPGDEADPSPLNRVAMRASQRRN
jgi:hypothetical protein